MKCRHCQQDIEENSQFCPNCEISTKLSLFLKSEIHESGSMSILEFKINHSNKEKIKCLEF